MCSDAVFYENGTGHWSIQNAIAAPIKQARKLLKKRYKSLTWDRGSEMAGHAKFTIAVNFDVFFCGPLLSWQPNSAPPHAS